MKKRTHVFETSPAAMIGRHVDAPHDPRSVEAIRSAAAWRPACGRSREEVEQQEDKQC